MRAAAALDVRAAHRGGVEQQGDEVVVQEVHLVDVQNTAVGRGEESPLGVLFGEGGTRSGLSAPGQQTPRPQPPFSLPLPPFLSFFPPFLLTLYIRNIDII